MTRKTLVSVIGMLLIGVLSLLYMARMGLPLGFGADTRAATLRVADSNGLVVGSKVMLRGVPIGTVSTITPSAQDVTVRLEYDPGRPIPDDSAFRVESLSALGEAFVEVLPASADGPYLADGAVVDDQRIVEPIPFPEFSQRLTEMLEQVDPAAVRSIFEVLDVGLPDGDDVAGDLERAGTLLASTFQSRAEEVGTILRTVQPLLQRTTGIPADLRNSAPVMKDFGVGFSGVLDGVRFATIKGPLTSIDVGAAPLIRELQKFLDVNADDLEIIGTSLLPGVTAGSARIQSIDIAGLLANAVRAVDDGALTVRLNTPTGGGGR